MVLVYAEIESELSGFVWLSPVGDKTRQDNDVIDRTGAFFFENDIDLLWLIGPIVIFQKYHTRQWRDRSYKWNLRRKRY